MLPEGNPRLAVGEVSIAASFNRAAFFEWPCGLCPKTTADAKEKKRLEKRMSLLNMVLGEWHLPQERLEIALRSACELCAPKVGMANSVTVKSS